MAEQNERMGWGLIGGGENSQIGFVHRCAAEIDRDFSLVAGALDIDSARGKAFARQLGIAEDRAYENWQAMLAGEKGRKDRLSLVSIATPNDTHFAITRAFLRAGFHVLCEKPITKTVQEARELIDIAAQAGVVCAVNYGYSGYPMVRQMRAMVKAETLGQIRVVKAEFAGGFMADAEDAENPRVRWRFDPKQAGVSAITMDAGIHALHMACFVCDQNIMRVSADFAHGIKSRVLEDDAWVAFRMQGGIIGRLWASGLAIGRAHGLTLQVFGEEGGLFWQQEQPNQLLYTPLNQATRILQRGDANLAKDAADANHIAIGHAEGMVFAFSNIYRDLAKSMRAQDTPHLPTASDGHHSLQVIHAIAQSASENGTWIEI
ncbi:MAG: Gfo/Idh/MocA family oxidoreductase [Pseudomonadota bacterium]